jgi:23S rRNA pseudouridine1911/1915/1917 synthase
MSPQKEFLVAAEDGEGLRLDWYLSRKVPELARSQVQRLVDTDKVAVNGERKKSSYKLRVGDRVVISFEPRPPAPGLTPEDIPLEVIYSDPDLIVINKPSGLVVHPGAGAASGTLANSLVRHFPELAGVGPADRPGIVHRLDKETSGLMVVARTPAAYEALVRMFKRREVHKTYLGLVWGRMGRPEGEFDWPIGRHPKHGQRFSTRGRSPRQALTAYKVRKVFAEFSLLEIRPVTGRTHQIRVHLAAAGHPVAGDNRYGHRRPKKRFPRLFLHAWKLAFSHPISGRQLEFSAPLPEELEKLIPAK